MKKKTLILIVLLFAMTLTFCQNSSSLVGTYLKQDGKSKIEFYQTGNTYSGKVVWLKEPNNASGQPLKDVNNPDKSLKNRTIINCTVIKNLQYDGEGSYIKGEAYRPEEGDNIKLKIQIKSNGTILVTGTKYGFSRSEIWTKV